MSLSEVVTSRVLKGIRNSKHPHGKLHQSAKGDEPIRSARHKGGVGKPLYLRLLSSRNRFADLSETFQCIGSSGNQEARGVARPKKSLLWRADFVGIDWLCIITWRPMVTHLADSLLFSPWMRLGGQLARKVLGSGSRFCWNQLALHRNCSEEWCFCYRVISFSIQADSATVPGLS